MISFPDLYSLVPKQQAIVADRLGGGWNLVLRRNCFDWKIERLVQSFLQLDSFHLLAKEQDILFWKADSKGKFTVKSC